MRRGVWAIPVVGFAGGLFSGMLGVGGGIIMVPGLLLFTGLARRRAHATSLAAIVPVSAVGALVYAVTEGSVDVAIAAVLAAGAVVGAPLGVRALGRIPEPALRLIFVAVSLALGVRMLVT